MSTSRAPASSFPIQPWGGTTQMFWDSDLGKSIETIAYSLYRRPNPKLEARADEIIDMYEKLQDEDGYLNAWFQRVAARTAAGPICATITNSIAPAI